MTLAHNLQNVIDIGNCFVRWLLQFISNQAGLIY